MKNNKKEISILTRISNQSGGISIFLVIILPVIILGCAFAYALFYQLENENQMQKLAYASSEAYLSRYNAYMFNQFGILVNSDDISLESAIVTYALKNNLIANRDSLTIENSRVSLDDHDVFLDALNTAAYVVVGQSVLQYGINIFEQNKSLLKIKNMYNTFAQVEKGIEPYFDELKIMNLLGKLKESKNIEDISKNETIILQYLQTQQAGFENQLQYLRSTVDQFSQNGVEDETSDSENLKMFINQKKSEFEALEKSFKHNQDEIQEMINIATQIKNQIMDYERETNNLEVELSDITDRINTITNKDKMTPSDQIQLDALTLSKEKLILNREMINQTIQSLYVSLKDSIKVEVTEVSKSLYHKILDTLYTIEQKFSGVEIGNANLVIPEGYDHSKDQFSFESERLNQKVLISEYLMTVFQSYDQNCPRKIGFKDRLKTERVLKGEIEYIISGETDERKSLSQVKLKIVALRLPSNLMSLLQSSDKMKQLSQITIVLPQPWRMLAFSSGILLWSTAESYVDTNNLLKGESVSLFKTPDEWQVDIAGLIYSGENDKFGMNAKILESANSNSPSNSNSNSNSPSALSTDLYYQDYLRLLLYTQSIEKTVNRTMNLFEVELLKISDQQFSLAKFSNGHMVKIKWRDTGLLINQMHQLEFYNGTKP